MPESGYYAACAGLIARTDALEVAANNLANINSTGYKAQREYFSSLVANASAGVNANPLNKAVNNFGVLGGAHVDLAPGNLERTSNELDLAVEGTGFFQVQTKNGTRYTRDGNFILSSNRVVQTQSGDPVLSNEGQPIQLPEGQIAISSDGTVSVDNNVVARVGLVDLPGANMAPEGSTNFVAQGGTVKPATDSSIRQGMLESANLSAVSASVGLISIQRYADMMFRTLNIFHTEFNKSAAEDLPRV
ncbi:MAG TPA: flagellar hook basal-body protein [Candidatus Angelobacter sp.]|jgi:flagellar basal-body rod protein FlgF/flagellar basal-body rod protein FlgG|nr:flagellar hook basal-body protein [Candidatus Angelobacter sp.]